MERRLFPWLYKWQNHGAALGSWEGSLTSCSSVGGLLSAVLIMLLKAALTPLKAASDSVFPCVLLRQTQLKGRSGLHMQNYSRTISCSLSPPSLPHTSSQQVLVHWPPGWPDHTLMRGRGTWRKQHRPRWWPKMPGPSGVVRWAPAWALRQVESSTSQSGTIRAASVSTALDPVILKDPLLVSNDHLSC